MSNNEITPPTAVTQEITKETNIISEETTTHPPSYRLFTKAAVMLATLFGSALAGGILMAINYKRLGDISGAIQTVLYSLAAVVLAVFLACVLPDAIPRMLFVIPQVYGVAFLMETGQEPRVNRHIREKGQVESNWFAFGISIVVLLCVLGAFKAIVPLLILS